MPAKLLEGVGVGTFEQNRAKNRAFQDDVPT